MTNPPPYAVKLVEPVMMGADIMVRRYILAPGEEIPWHRHSSTDDLCILLSGSLRVQTRDPEAEHLLAPGGYRRTVAGTPHRVSNAGTDDCCFMLIQGVGVRDFVKL